MVDISMVKDYYHVNCSLLESVAKFPCKALEIVIRYHSPSTVSLTLQVAKCFPSIKTNIHKICFFDYGALESQSINLKLENDTVVYEDVISNNSKEIHWIRVRQQDPVTRLWSMCEIRFFSSQHGLYTSICIEWLYSDILL